MPQFTDARGDAWSFAITIATAARVKADHDVDLLRFDECLARLAADQFLLCSVLFACLSTGDVAQRGVDLVGFLERLDGGALERAAAAWMETYTAFFPQRLRQPLDLLRQTIDRKVQTATERLEALAASGELQATVETVVDRILGNSSGGPPGSSAATPDPAPSAS